ncbi:hypothetical protein TNCV_514921 [Trichonephila clavipes]|nr:hypothetical protein TNCV_514921 [Trichonephila clavipes]
MPIDGGKIADISLTAGTEFWNWMVKDLGPLSQVVSAIQKRRQAAEEQEITEGGLGKGWYEREDIRGAKESEEDWIFEGAVVRHSSDRGKTIGRPLSTAVS